MRVKSLEKAKSVEQNSSSEAGSPREPEAETIADVVLRDGESLLLEELLSNAKTSS
jgi:hypothetical protein